MIKSYKTVEEKQIELPQMEDSSWIRVVAPTPAEITHLAEFLGTNDDNIKAALDIEETPRVEFETGNSLIIVRVPVIDESGVDLAYDTIPLGIMFVKDCIITVCSQELPVVNDFFNGKIKSFYTYKKTRFLFQLLYRNAVYFLQYLKQIDRHSDEIEKILHKSTQNSELIKLLKLEKSLVYFSTALKSNDSVLDKIMKSDMIKKYADDTPLLDDTIIENRQALEMANIYSNITSNTMDAFASIISNNQNLVIKILTVVTIAITIPTIISGFFGMNVVIPAFADSPFAFWGIVIFSTILTILVTLYMRKKKMF